MLREWKPTATIGFFLHIPFPPVELFAYLPWRSSVLEGLLGADVVAFQTRQSVDNFRDAALRYSEAKPISNNLEVDGRLVRLQWAPISIDSEAFATAAARPAVAENAVRLRKRIEPAGKLLLGVDRLDYTKGIDHRLRALQTLHERYPLEARDTVLLQLAVPSREELIQYARQRENVEQLVGQINGEFGQPGYTPVVYMYRHLDFEDLVAAYVAADVMFVTPLADGMNLVAKEFIASRTSDDGVLVLSEFAGAAAELQEAIQVNPLNLDGLAETLLYSVMISPEDAAQRMSALRETVRVDECIPVVAQLPGGAREVRSREPRLTSDLDDALKRAARADRLLVAVDFDGTLSPIVSNYESAVADRDALETLFGLAALPRTRVVVISGRSRADLERRIGSHPPQVVLVGSHGAEHSSDSPVEEEARVESFMEALNGLRDRYPGTRIERKPYSLAVHYRNVSERGQDKVRDEAIERVGPLAAGTKEGKKVIEFLAVLVDKGAALELYREWRPPARARAAA